MSVITNTLQRLTLVSALATACADVGSPVSIEVVSSGSCVETNPPTGTAIVTVRGFPSAGRLSLWESPPPKDNAPCPTDVTAYKINNQISPRHIRDAAIYGATSMGSAGPLTLNNVTGDTCFIAVFQPEPYDDSNYTNNATVSPPAQFRCN